MLGAPLHAGEVQFETVGQHRRARVAVICAKKANAVCEGH